MTPPPAKKCLGEVVLGSILLLHTSLQQHLLIQLSLLLLLFQMLLHPKPLPVVLLDVLCGVTALKKHSHCEIHKTTDQQMLCLT